MEKKYTRFTIEKSLLIHSIRGPEKPSRNLSGASQAPGPDVQRSILQVTT